MAVRSAAAAAGCRTAVEQPAGDHPVVGDVVAGEVVVEAVVAVADASSVHRPGSVAVAAVVAVGRAVASVDSCSATAVRTFPWPSFRSSAVAAAAVHRPSSAACGVAAVPGTAGQDASVVGCGGAEDAVVAFASWSETCRAKLRTVVGGSPPDSDLAGRASACGD